MLQMILYHYLKIHVNNIQFLHLNTQISTNAIGPFVSMKFNYPCGVDELGPAGKVKAASSNSASPSVRQNTPPRL